MPSPILTAVLPVFAIIMLGYAFRRADFPTAGFWDGAEKLTYFTLLPLLLFQSIATADLTQARGLGPLAGAVVLAYGLQTLAAFAFWAMLPRTDGKSFGALFQGRCGSIIISAFRWCWRCTARKASRSMLS